MIKSIIKVSLRSRTDPKPIDVTKAAVIKLAQVGVDLKTELSKLATGMYSIEFKLETMTGGETFDVKTFYVLSS